MNERVNRMANKYGHHELSARAAYIVGSLRNPRVPIVATQIRAVGWDAFDDWFSAGPEADDHWQKYEKERGHDFATALAAPCAQNIFQFDKRHLDRCSAGVLIAPAGKSGHLELGYLIGQGKPGYILLDGEPERFDVMYNFATAVCTSVEQLLGLLEAH